jgi:trehalose 6-phosphate synthase/phosphatase
MGVSSYRTLWIGWPGIYVKPGRDRDALTALLAAEGYAPVWLEAPLLDLYYNGFCNSVLWQLFHYVPINLDSWQRVTEHQTMQMQWMAYSSANARFAEVVLAQHRDAASDVVWVQDYHLMLLPSLLKAAVPRMKVRYKGRWRRERERERQANGASGRGAAARATPQKNNHHPFSPFPPNTNNPK